MASSCLLPINDSDSDHMNDQNNMDSISKPTNCLKLIGSNVMAFGLELCSSAGFTYITPILLKDGFSDKALTFILSVGPFISLILVPMIGGWSDKCQSRYGRRRPFMFVLACLFGWMGVMCHDMYYTDFVGQVIYKGRPHADSFAVLRYDKGIRMGSVGLLLHCLSEREICG